MLARMPNPHPHAADFARYYDLIYSDKDYPAEVALFNSLVRKHATRPTQTVLDAGCGTGGHSLRLAELGYDVCGVDRSEAMLELARQKGSPSRGSVEWIQQDLQSLDLGRSFDACGCFFAVLSFQLSNDQMRAALEGIRRHLDDEGLLLGDLWYGPAVLSEGPEKRLKTLEKDGRRILKYSTPELDALRHINVVHQHVVILDGDGRIEAEVKEAQAVRFWFPLELEAFLESAGFELLQLFAYPDPKKPPTIRDWDLGFVARARPRSG